MDKLTMATKVLLKLIETDKTGFDAEGIAAYSFEIADAMQVEAEKRVNKERPNALKEEWQPDWSQAPEWASSWGVAEIGQAWWFSGEWHANNRGGFSSTGFIKAEKAPSFDYQGNWKESLRKRPQ